MFIAFFACLEFAMSNSSYNNIILKPKQVACLESLYLGKDVVCVLPTGYGKSLVFHSLPSLMFARNRSRETQIEFLKTWKLSGMSTKDVSSIVIVVSPLNALIHNQISQLRSQVTRNEYSSNIAFSGTAICYIKLMLHETICNDDF